LLIISTLAPEHLKKKLLIKLGSLDPMN